MDTLVSETIPRKVSQSNLEFVLWKKFWLAENRVLSLCQVVQKACQLLQKLCQIISESVSKNFRNKWHISKCQQKTKKNKTVTKSYTCTIVRETFRKSLFYVRPGGRGFMAICFSHVSFFIKPGSYGRRFGVYRFHWFSFFLYIWWLVAQVCCWCISYDDLA